MFNNLAFLPELPGMLAILVIAEIRRRFPVVLGRYKKLSGEEKTT
jgi:hypothetical protein